MHDLIDDTLLFDEVVENGVKYRVRRQRILVRLVRSLRGGRRFGERRLRDHTPVRPEAAFGYMLVPPSSQRVHLIDVLDHRRVRAVLALAIGKQACDKRETIRRRELDRETRAAVKARRAQAGRTARQ
jgi:hypothetical protein